MLLAVVAVIVVAIASLYVFLGSQAALDYVVRRAVEGAEGHLVIEGAEGSLLSTVRIARIKWTGDELDVEARDTAVVWSPFDLLSRKVNVGGLGAKRLTIDFKKAESKGGLPSTLALPLEVDVRNIGVERLEWKTIAQRGSVTGIAFNYAGGEVRHEIRDLRFVTEQGTLAGTARVAANPPYDLSADFTFEGDGEWKTASARLAIAGRVERMNIDAKGAFRDADVTIKASVAPFEPAPVTSADIEAQGVDLAKFMDSLPATQLSLTLSARPDGAGFRGTLRARNETPGPIDKKRVPVAAVASDFAWDGTTLALTGVDAQLAGNARARGSVSLAPSGGPVKLDLSLANVDLAQLMTTLIATRLTGTLAGEVDKDRQVLRGDLRDKDLALAFDAVVEGRRVNLRSAKAQAGAGTLTGSGTIDLDAPRAFAIKARAAKFDPSRFVAAPEGQLDGSIDARGTLSPVAVTGTVTIDPGSRFAGLDVAGTARGTVGLQSAKDLYVDLRVGASTIKITGGYGNATDALAYDVDVPKLAQLRPLAVRYAKVSLPEPAGRIVARARHRERRSREPRDHRRRTRRVAALGTVSRRRRHSTSTRRSAEAARSIYVRSKRASQRPSSFSRRRLSRARQSTQAGRSPIIAQRSPRRAKASMPPRRFRAASASFAVRTAPSTRRGTAPCRRFANRGAYAFALRAPARVSVARDRYMVSDLHVDVADGHVDVASLLLDEGRITTQGSFTGVPVNSVAKLAGSPLPFASTLTIGGDWSIAATPRLSGTFSVRREAGDWYGGESTTLGPAAARARHHRACSVRPVRRRRAHRERALPLRARGDARRAILARGRPRAPDSSTPPRRSPRA